MKTLANCTPREFMKQTNRIRISVDEWLTATKILEIRQRVPEFEEPKKPESREDLAESIEKRQQAVAEQMRKNTFSMLEAMLDANAEKTVELLALVCFVEPEDADKHTMSEYLSCINELINDEAVIGFFVSLVRLGGSNMVQAATA